MTQRIIDFHSHLGDIFATQKNCIYKYDAKLELADNQWDCFANLSKSGFTEPLIDPTKPEEVHNLIVVGGLLCLVNTIERLTERMDAFGLSHVCLMPIYPHIAFEDYLAATKIEPRILPFTSADWTADATTIAKKLEKDVARGAKGLKIHPVLQPVSLLDPKVHEVLEFWKTTELPVISHCGSNSYYAEPELEKTECPENGDPKYFVQAVKENPEVKWVAAHAGGLTGYELDYLSTELKGYDQVWYDTTFRSEKDIRKMVKLFGEDRILFGSDTPFALTGESLAEIYKAVGKGSDLADKILYRNAASLMKLPV